MRIRDATIDDARGIASVHVASWQSTYRGHVPDEFLDTLDVDERTHRWKNRLERSDGDTFVAERSRIAGFCSLAPTRDTDARRQTGEITAIYVDPNILRQGVGRALVAAAVSRAHERAYRRLSLWVLFENARARAFYEALGFRHDGGRKVDTSLVGVPLDEGRYGLELARRVRG